MEPMKIIKTLIVLPALVLWGAILTAQAEETKPNVSEAKLNNGVVMSRFDLGTFMQSSEQAEQSS